ncbi:hypothetical protein DPMN_002958 [Dreissena polymorpha]|uniref:Uncharacterized protein n=1 Tax=Dreissena polymorpha TaxID=45954 RepID=A0A9D4MPQ4_DREPO|nr:hypothetical protein DPMN_002958 [Dreissena polymorpha]
MMVRRPYFQGSSAYSVGGDIGQDGQTDGQTNAESHGKRLRLSQAQENNEPLSSQIPGPKISKYKYPPTETMAITGHKNSSKCNNPTVPLVHLHAPKLWPKCSLDNHCLPSNKLILMFAPPSHFTVH